MDPNLYVHPGITKNLSKTMCGKLKKFIKKQFKEKQEILDDPDVKHFLSISQFDYKAKDIKNLKSGPIGKQIVNHYFGNLVWCHEFGELHKTDINYYFQFNHIWYDENQNNDVNESLKNDNDNDNDNQIKNNESQQEGQLNKQNDNSTQNEANLLKFQSQSPDDEQVEKLVKKVKTDFGDLIKEIDSSNIEDKLEIELDLSKDQN